MKVKTPLAAVAFAAIAGFAGMAFAASNTAPTTTNAPCAEQMRADYAELAQAMNLTGPAKQAFDKYVASRQDIASKHYAWHEAKNGKRPANREEAMRFRAEHMKVRADMLEQIASAREVLDKSLTPEQQAMMDEYEPRYAMGPGYGRGMGPGAGMNGPRHHYRGHRGDWGYGPGCGGYGYGPGCAGGPGCVYNNGPRCGDGWGWHGPRHGYGQYGYGPGCRW